MYLHPNGRTLYILNAKGTRSYPNPQNQYIGRLFKGTLQILPVPDQSTLQRYTRTVRDCCPYRDQLLSQTEY